MEESKKEYYAVRATDVTGGSSIVASARGGKRSASWGMYDDEDLLQKRSAGTRELIEKTITPVRNDILEVKSTLENLIKVDKWSKIPIGIRIALTDTFQCRICQSTIVPPVISTKCCKIILGCETCVNEWYSGDEALTKSSPSCRAERGLADTMALRGMDDFLRDIKDLLED